MFLLPKNTGNIIVQFATIAILAFFPSNNLHAGLIDWLFGEEKAPRIEKSDEPSRDDLIKAVQNHVASKTYEKTTHKVEQRPRRCSQIDVDLDPHAKRNPELAKCPYVGATYFVSETVPVRRRYECKRPPDHGWSVQKIGSEKWRVSNSGSTWDLTKISSKSVDVDVIYIHVRGSKSAFKIAAHQEC
jgi:hypothetical protein